MIDEKKLIEELEKIFETDEQNIDCTLSDFAYHVFDCIKAQPKFGEWIPCSVAPPQQPEENPIFDNKPLELYLVSVKNADYHIRAFWNGKFFTDGWSKVDVIAWQPLPQPYQPKGE